MTPITFLPYVGRQMLGAAVGLVALCAQAQTTSSTGAAAPASPDASAAHAAALNATPNATELRSVVIVADPLGVGELMTPADQVSGAKLTQGAQATLGETLNGEPGVSSTYYGPNASRPTIRGLDGDRIRLLDNGASMADASGLSYDHAVPVDPISIERIEVLRGPGTLRFGGSAVGGVINMVDSRIPREALFDQTSGVTGKVDAGWSSGADEARGAASLDTGTKAYGLHVDAFARDAADTRAPIALACTQAGVTRSAARICNSANHTQGGALGGSLFFDRGYLGTALSTYASRYGTVAEDESTIRMRSDRWSVQGEWKPVDGWWESVQGHAHLSDYRHTEYDAATPVTTFRNRGSELRVEARQRERGGWHGLVGLQIEQGRFTADGAEAFTPYTRSASAALFAYEEWHRGADRWSLGARLERGTVRSDGSPRLARFVPGERAFTAPSAALGWLHELTPGWQATANVAANARAPKNHELFANGPHNATATYEVGQAALEVERSTSADLGLRWHGTPRTGLRKFDANVYATRFQNYIGLSAAGVLRDSDGAAGVRDCGDGTSVESGCRSTVLPQYDYRAVRALFTGFEASATWRLLQGTETLDLEARADSVRATDLDSGQPLPRVAPARLGATLIGGRDAWSARLGLDHSAAQNRVPTGDRPTAGYTLWNLGLSYKRGGPMVQWLWFARLDNASNQLAWSASSILSQSAPGKAPLPGRSLRLGVQANF